MGNIDEVVNRILEIKNSLQSGDIVKLTGDELSLIAIELAAQKMTLGEFVALARNDKDLAAQALDDVRTKAYRDFRHDNMTIKDAEIEARQASAMALTKSTDTTYQYERLRLLREDCESLLNAIKSRLILFQIERNEARHGQVQ